MATNVSMKIDHPIAIGNVDVVFEVRNGTSLLGKVKLSKGGIDWQPAHKQAIKATWKEFSEWMES